VVEVRQGALAVAALGGGLAAHTGDVRLAATKDEGGGRRLT